jgi:hypothetical protein
VKTSSYFKVMLVIHRLPRLLAAPLAGGFSLWLRQVDCRAGKHTPGGVEANYCAGCGQLINSAAWRNWTVSLRDGSYRVVPATNEIHARNLVRFGEERPGQMNTRAFLERRQVVIDEDILTCTPGQIVSVRTGQAAGHGGGH